MSTILGNGTTTFGDNSSISTANISYSSVTSPKTNLSQFINNLGNYGGFLTGASINTAAIDTLAFPRLRLSVSGTTVSLVSDNCNCNCACNC